MSGLETLWQTVIAVLLAIAGGFARLLNLKDKQAMKVSRIFSEIFVSGFAGVMITMLVRASGIPSSWTGVIAGMAGWTGPRILDAVAGVTSRVLGLKIDEKPEDRNSPPQ